MTPKTLLIDGRRLGAHGIGVYTRNVISALVELIESKSLDLELGVLLLESEKDNVKNYPWFNNVRKHFFNAKPYSLKEYFSLANYIDSLNYDLVHIPHYTLPLGVKTKSVITVHDLIHVTHPEKFYYPFVAKILIGHALRKADFIITVSESSKNEILKAFKVKESKLKVIPNLMQFKDCKSGEKENYFLAIISTFKKHKGLDFLLKAFSVFRKENPDFKLLLAGSGIEKGKTEIMLNDDYVLSKDKIELLGRVSDDELKNYLSSAKGLCIASDIEGFCIPMLEAHMFNLPVVAKPLSVLKELEIERFDYLAKDCSVNEYVRAMNSLAKSTSSLSDESKNNLSLQRDKFSFNSVAKQLLNVYQNIA